MFVYQLFRQYLNVLDLMKGNYKLIILMFYITVLQLKSTK